MGEHLSAVKKCKCGGCEVFSTSSTSSTLMTSWTAASGTVYHFNSNTGYYYIDSRYCTVVGGIMGGDRDDRSGTA